MDQVNNINQAFQCLIVFGIFGGLWGGILFIQSIFFGKSDSYQIAFDDQRKKFDKEFNQEVREEAINELNSLYTPVTNEHIIQFDTEICQVLEDDRIHGMNGG